MTFSFQGKKGLITGIANEHSIAWGCARAFHAAGASLAITYQNEKAEPYVRPLAQALNSPLVMPLDVQNETQLSTVFKAIKDTWGTLDFLLHAIAYAPKHDLQGRVTDCSREGFLQAIDISCYSFIRMAHYAEPLMTKGGTLLTVSYYGGEKVMPSYGIMGPTKAALEAAVRYLSYDLGPRKIRVNALSPGPIMTRAASGIQNFAEMIQESLQQSPEQELVTIEDVGAFAAFLVSDQARHITGDIHYIDSGFHNRG